VDGKQGKTRGGGNPKLRVVVEALSEVHPSQHCTHVEEAKPPIRQHARGTASTLKRTHLGERVRCAPCLSLVDGVAQRCGATTRERASSIEDKTTDLSDSFVLVFTLLRATVTPRSSLPLPTCRRSPGNPGATGLCFPMAGRSGWSVCDHRRVVGRLLAGRARSMVEWCRAAGCVCEL